MSFAAPLLFHDNDADPVATPRLTRSAVVSRGSYVNANATPRENHRFRSREEVSVSNFDAMCFELPRRCHEEERDKRTGYNDLLRRQLLMKFIIFAGDILHILFFFGLSFFSFFAFSENAR